MAHPIAVSLLVLGLSVTPVLAAEQDPNTGFVIAPGWEIVRNNCIACHSASLVTQNSGDRAHWLSLIRWMQETQGLWQLDDSSENTILEYLSSYYGPKEGTRRPALRADQLPPNPYRPSKT
ncbi:hypothetical protein [Denitrificimonas caeni]|uniref:hypothetical protein n=1 Tax=Denitrificimonas caeni TaxID=521720 RepID=UPI001964FEE0|nr:hypothetical protein [Denitrificimonas caeni]